MIHFKLKTTLLWAFVLFIALNLPEFRPLAFGYGNPRIVEHKSDGTIERIRFLNAYDRVTTVEVNKPLGHASAEEFTIASTSSNPQGDFNAALNTIRARGKPAKIIFDGKTYNLSKLRFNHFFHIPNVTDLTIDGNGSTLILDKPAFGFGVYNSTRVAIFNFNIKFKIRVGSAARVVLDRGKKAVKLNTAFQNQISQSNLYRRLTRIYLNQPNRNAFLLHADKRWLQSANSGTFAYNSVRKLYLPSDNNILKDFSIGQRLIIEHFEYDGNAFNIQDCSDISIRSNTVSNVPGMFLFAKRISSGLLVSNNVLKPDSKDSKSFVSAMDDGVHVDSAKQNIIVQYNNFQSNGDDGINLHSLYLRVLRKISNRQFVFQGNGVSTEETPPDIGDQVEFYTPGLKHIGLGKVKSVFKVATSQHRVDFENPISNVSVGDVVNIRTWQPKKFVILHNNLHDFWGRGMMIQARDGLISENTIRNVAGAGIQMTTDNFVFSESGSIRNVVVADNTIRNVAKSLLSQKPNKIAMGAISITARVNSSANNFGYSRSFVHKDLVIEFNKIFNVGGPGIFASSVDNVLVDRNTVKNYSQIPFSRNRPGFKYGVSAQSGYGNAIYNFYSRNVRLKNNDF